MYKITIADDSANLIMRDMLIEDYRRVRTIINDLDSRLDDLEFFQIEDLDFNVKVKQALEVLLEYYLPISEAHEIISEENI